MSESVNLRNVVLDILTEVNTNGEFSHLLISNALMKYQFLDKQERSFIQRLSLGTIENRIELDYILDCFSKTKASKMKPLIRNICEMAVYQIMFMDNVPDSAACNEAVKLATRRGFAGLKGFVNGVLRNVVRNKENISYPDKSKEYNKYLSIKYSMPEWIIEMWKEIYDDNTLEDILAGFKAEKNTFIRCNTFKVTPKELKTRLIGEGVTVEEVKEIDYAFKISGFDYLGALDSFNEGLFIVQDLSSIRAGVMAGIKEKDICLDVCAAPGGKTINAALLAGKEGMVISRDLTDYKVSLIEENLERLGINNVKAQCFDACLLDESMIEKADVVIADLPCSGLGIIGRKPDIKYNTSKDKIEELSRLQRDILSVVVKYVKKGGRLVYSTCTISTLENENNADYIENELGLKRLKQCQMLPTAGENDGFFVAEFVKE